MHVSTGFIAAFLSICEYTLLIDKNDDSTLPHNRAEELWDTLHHQGLISVKFNARKWAACREAFVQHGIIRITNRQFGPGKAMEWELGLYFPFLGLWKTSSWAPSMRGLVDFVEEGINHTQDKHNTLLQSNDPELPRNRLWSLVRPPP